MHEIWDSTLALTDGCAFSARRERDSKNFCKDTGRNMSLTCVAVEAEGRNWWVLWKRVGEEIRSTKPEEACSCYPFRS